MDILILFTKERISSLKGDRTDFTNKISESAKIISIENNAEDIHIQILEGFVPNASNTNKIIVFISSKKMKNNMGALILEFKQNLIKVLQLVDFCCIIYISVSDKVWKDNYVKENIKSGRAVFS